MTTRTAIGADYPGTSDNGLIILLGLEGSGKDTQGNILAAETGRRHYITGDIVRAARKADPEFASYMARLPTAPYLDDAWVNHFSSKYIIPGSIVNGTPRSVAQAQHLDQHWQTQCVLFYDIDPTVATERLVARGRETGRADDTPEGIAARLALSMERIPAIVEYYKTSKTPIFTINANSPRETITETTRRIIAP